MDADPNDDWIYCPSCGEPIHRRVNFCRHCGEPNRKSREAPGGSTDRPTGEGGWEDDGWGTDERAEDGWDDGERGGDGGEEGRRGDGEQGGSGWEEGGREEGGWGDAGREERRRRERPPDAEADVERAERTAVGWDHDDGGTQRDETAPWEREDIRRVERGIFEDEHGEAEAQPQWRKYLPDELGGRDESTTRVVLTAAGMGILGVGLLVIITLVTVLLGQSFGMSILPLVFLGTVLGQYIGFAGLGLWYLRYRGFEWDRIWGYLGVRWPTVKELAIAIGSWLLILVGLIVLSLALEVVMEALGRGSPDEPEQGLDEIIPQHPALVPALILMMFLVVGPCEELLFRGIIQGRLRERLPAAPSILIASAVFAVIHVVALIGSLEAILVGITFLFTSSLVIGAVYEYTESLVAASVLHGVHNSIVIVITYLEATGALEEGFVSIVPFLLLLPVG